MNKIEELEKQLKEEMSKIQVDLKEKYKWIVGKYAKYNVCQGTTAVQGHGAVQRMREAYYLPGRP